MQQSKDLLKMKCDEIKGECNSRVFHSSGNIESDQTFTINYSYYGKCLDLCLCLYLDCTFGTRFVNFHVQLL